MENRHKHLFILLLCAFFPAMSLTAAGQPSLARAACDGNLQAVKARLTEGANIEGDHSDSHMTPLWRAALSGHKDVVAFLLDNGAHNVVESCKAAIANDHLAIVKLFLEHKNGIHDLKLNGPSLINQAVGVRRLSIFKFLLRKGARPDNSALFTLLRPLAHTGQRPVYDYQLQEATPFAQLLVDNGADPTVTEKKGDHDSPLHLLARIVPFSTDIKYLIPLARAIIRVDKINESLATRHEIDATIFGNYNQQEPAIIDIILGYSEKPVDVRNWEEETPLMIAAKTGKKYLCKLLIKAGANPELTDRWDKLALSHLPDDLIEELCEFKPGDPIEGDLPDLPRQAEPEPEDEPEPNPDRNESQISLPPNKWGLVTLAIGAIATAAYASAYAWRTHQAKKRFKLTVQRLIKLEQRKQNHEINDFVYAASKKLLLVPYKNNPKMLKKLETDVATQLAISDIENYPGEATQTP